MSHGPAHGRARFDRACSLRPQEEGLLNACVRQETPTSLSLERLRRNGVLVDVGALKQGTTERFGRPGLCSFVSVLRGSPPPRAVPTARAPRFLSLAEVDKLRAACEGARAEFGRRFGPCNLASPRAVAEALYDRLGVPSPDGNEGRSSPRARKHASTRGAVLHEALASEALGEPARRAVELVLAYRRAADSLSAALEVLGAAASGVYESAALCRLFPETAQDASPTGAFDGGGEGEWERWTNGRKGGGERRGKASR